MRHGGSVIFCRGPRTNPALLTAYLFFFFLRLLGAQEKIEYYSLRRVHCLAPPFVASAHPVV